MRIRSLKPEWLDDDRMLSCSVHARLLSVALICMADDYGNGRAGKSTASRVFPESPGDFRNALTELEGWYVDVYEVRGQSYYSIRNWDRHQKVNKPGKPHVPGPLDADSKNAQESPGHSQNPRADRDRDRDQDQDREQDHAREAALPDDEPGLTVPDRLPTSAPPLKRKAPRDDQRARLLAAWLDGYGNQLGLQPHPGAPGVCEWLDMLAGKGASPDAVRAAAVELARDRWWERKGITAPGLRHFAENFERYHTAASEAVASKHREQERREADALRRKREREVEVEAAADLVEVNALADGVLASLRSPRKAVSA